MTFNDNETLDHDGQDSDYDGAWKEALRFHLMESFTKCFPTFVNLIDWSCEVTWLDKEISQIVGQFGRRNREVDLLFKVRLLDGRDQWILFHLEVQTSYEADFAFRIDLYNAGLKWMFRQDVVTFAILADLKPNWRPDRHLFEFGDFRSDRQFPICKLLDHLATDWVEDTSLIVQVARAQIAALQTASDPDARFSAKTQLVRNLYTLGYTADRIREIFRLIDWMMRLRPDLDRRFKSELVVFEEELHMPYVTSIERLAREEGREEGREQGRERHDVISLVGLKLAAAQAAAAGFGLQAATEQEVFVESVLDADGASTHSHVCQPANFSRRDDVGGSVVDRGGKVQRDRAAPPAFIGRHRVHEQALLGVVAVRGDLGVCLAQAHSLGGELRAKTGECRAIHMSR